MADQVPRVKCIEHYSYSEGDKIGKGFSSTVFKGKDIRSQQSVAVKVIDLHKFSQSTMHKLLQSQIEIIKALNHSSILKCLDVFITVNSCYIITELCVGGDLASEIKKKGRLRGIEALRVMYETTQAVAHLSSQNIIHRDIKPANILLQEGKVKLADFGFAKRDHPDSRKEKYSIGSPLYMSPQALFHHTYGKENDIWSLGIVFYEILQGRPPWDPKNEKELKTIISENKDVFFRIAIREELESLIKGCLRHDKNDRLAIEAILGTLQAMMADMLSQNNIAYRETLTRRTPQALSCIQLKATMAISPILKTTSIRPYLLRGHHMATEGDCSNKENEDEKRELTLKTQAPSPITIEKQISVEKNQNIIRAERVQRVYIDPSHRFQRGQTMDRNGRVERIERADKTEKTERTERVEEKLKAMSVEESSRHNHYILKSVINYTRLIYKNFSRVDKMQMKENQKQDIQLAMIGLLQHTIELLKNAVRDNSNADSFGLVQFDKFKLTRCFSKTILVINEYHERYSKFSLKLKRSILDKRYLIIREEKNFGFYANKLKTSLKDLFVIDSNSDHNIGLDFLISIVVLTNMLNQQSTSYFHKFSHIEDIVETEPVPLQDEDLAELRAKLQTVLQ